MTATTEELEADRRTKISKAKIGKTHSPEHREALSKALKGRSAPNKGKAMTPETRDKVRQARSRQTNVDTSGLSLGATRTKEQRASCWTPEKRAAQALKTTLAYREGRMQVHGRYRGVWTVYDGPSGPINMRSKSETLFAYSLDAQKVDWQYEPQRFDLGWATYLPDFYLPAFDRWIEIKGHWTESSQRKFDEFSQTHRISAVLAQDVLKMV